MKCLKWLKQCISSPMNRLMGNEDEPRVVSHNRCLAERLKSHSIRSETQINLSRNIFTNFEIGQVLHSPSTEIILRCFNSLLRIYFNLQASDPPESFSRIEFHPLFRVLIPFIATLISIFPFSQMRSSFIRIEMIP